MQVWVNLVECIVLVMGSVFVVDLVQVVEKVGYGVEVIEDDIKCCECQQEIVIVIMKCFCWQVIVVLVVGILVMVWGMIGDNMMVIGDNCSLWLVIGLIMFVVMVFVGGYFYCNVWKSLLNGMVMMDMLVVFGIGVVWFYFMSVNLWLQWFLMEVWYFYYEVSVMIIGLINFGYMLEVCVCQCFLKVLEKLFDFILFIVCVVIEDGEKSVLLVDVQSGMLLWFIIGDCVLVDGEIIQGEVWFDEVMLIGEFILQ